MLQYYQAALENRQAELKEAMVGQALGVSVALKNVLDMAFNQGKDKILENWLKNLNAPEGSAAKPKAPAGVSPQTLAYFGGQPVIAKTRKD